MTSLPDPLPVRPRGPLDARFRVPGSRSITNRALVASALAGGESRLEGAFVKTVEHLSEETNISGIAVLYRPIPPGQHTHIHDGFKTDRYFHISIGNLILGARLERDGSALEFCV